MVAGETRLIRPELDASVACSPATPGAKLSTPAQIRLAGRTPPAAISHRPSNAQMPVDLVGVLGGLVHLFADDLPGNFVKMHGEGVAQLFKLRP